MMHKSWDERKKSCMKARSKSSNTCLLGFSESENKENGGRDTIK